MTTPSDGNPRLNLDFKSANLRARCIAKRSNKAVATTKPGCSDSQCNPADTTV